MTKPGVSGHVGFSALERLASDEKDDTQNKYFLEASEVRRAKNHNFLEKTWLKGVVFRSSRACCQTSSISRLRALRVTFSKNKKYVYDMA